MYAFQVRARAHRSIGGCIPRMRGHGALGNWGTSSWFGCRQMETGMDERLLSALRTWFSEEWKLNKTVYITSEPFTQQVDLMTRTGLKLKIELLKPGKPRKRLAFG